MSNCIFCKIIADQSESDLTVYENDHVVALISLQQKAANLGHVLLLPKAHTENLYALPDDSDVPMMAALKILARATKQAFAADGINIRQNNEAAAGQDVFHLHFHIIPRFDDDAFDDHQYEKLPLDIRKDLATRLRVEVLNEIEKSEKRL